MQRIALYLALLLTLPAVVSAETYIVHPDGTGDFLTIQAAIDAVVDGDVIELTDGIFTGDGNRDIDYVGKAITVRSQSGDPEACIIHCDGDEGSPHRGFNFRSGEGPESVLAGVTIRDGWAENWGGGILCDGGVVPDPCPTFINVTLCDNTALPAGGGMCCLRASPTLMDCTFSGNMAVTSSGQGGGLHCNTHASPTLVNCTLTFNHATWYGGAVGCYAESAPTLINCTLYGNWASEGSGVGCGYACDPVLENTIIAYSIEAAAVYCLEPANPALTCCDLYGNEGGDWVGCIEQQYGLGGNISEDPWFCDADNGDFTLHEDSPCAPFMPPNEECDLIGAWPVGCGPMALPDQQPLRPSHPLLLAAPNPFTAATRITFDVPRGASDPVRLSIHDLIGRRVRILDSAILVSGPHGIVWDGLDECGNHVGSGMYYVRLRAGEQDLTTRLMLLR